LQHPDLAYGKCPRLKDLLDILLVLVEESFTNISVIGVK